MTFPRAERDLLMFFASSSTEPSAPVLLTCDGRYSAGDSCGDSGGGDSDGSGGVVVVVVRLEKEMERECM